ncbi:MAG: hypothetical protein M1142_06700 [Patescibacteria group bacterium]|nr:hypothetical protein [Patescibacteria group bacterium]
MEKSIQPPIKNLSSRSLNKIFISILVISIILGTSAGYMLAKTGKKVNADTTTSPSATTEAPKTAQQDAKTFRDFAEGTIQKKPTSSNPDDYSEGTHLLIRDGAVPVALTSSVVDLSQYEGKKVKVFGETQKAVKEGWLMDVGRVEEE